MTSDNSFSVLYEFTAQTTAEAEKAADEIAREQTAELPSDAIPPALQKFVGDVSKPSQSSAGRFQCTITYDTKTVGKDLLQFLNVLFGNISIKPDIKLLDFDLGGLAPLFPGPAVGIDGIRERLSIHDRPLSCTALKPMCSDPVSLANIAFEATLGGIDIIKDDHGLANQSMAPFRERVSQCCDAVRRAEQESGKRTLYFPNVTTRFEDLEENIAFAKEAGADGILMIPELTGLATLASLVQMDSGLPIMAHPAFSGPYTIHLHSGFTPALHYGKLWRALGADAVIYPNAGGRFAYTRQQCLNINRALREPLHSFKSAFPVPGGGIDRNTVSDWKNLYGNNTIFLIGGSLYLHPEGLKTAVQEFQRSLSAR